MSSELEFTGERFTPECVREIWYEHMHRYVFATQFVGGKSVLDAACGEGYGSALLAGVAGNVTGVDISGPVIEHAKRQYESAANLEFLAADCTDLPFDDGRFDLVVSFETIEHLENQAQMLREFRRVLADDGLLILSSPDRARYSDELGFDNEYHVRELYREELEQLLAIEFPAVRLLGQSLAFHSMIHDPGAIESVRIQTQMDDGSLQHGQVVHSPVYWIALCGGHESHLPEIQATAWLFDDEAGSVYAHYHHEIRKNMAAGTILAERQAEIESLEKQLAAAKRPWWRKLKGD